MIKKITLSVVIASALYIAPNMLSGQFNSGLVFANEAKETIKSVKVPAMRNRVYTQLARAQSIADQGDRTEGLKVLDAVKERINGLNSYERAMLWNFYGFMHYGGDNLPAAMQSFEQVVAEEAIPESLRLSTLYSLAQLSMQQNDFTKTLSYLAQWKKINTKDITSNQLMLFAQVHYQNKQYTESLAYVDKAIVLTTEKNAIPKENWLILQRANHFELKQPKQVTQVIETLIRYYDKPQYWLQLSGMYGEIGEEDKQLAVMESAWQAGYIEKSSDIITLAQLYRYHNVPYKAAKLLADAIDSGKVSAEEKYFDMLAQAYTAAKNDEKAIPVLIKASEIADTGKFDARLAQVYLNMEKWQLAIDAAEQALTRGNIDHVGNMHLVKGMASFNLQHFNEALTAFTQAQTLKESATMAKQWYSYVEREQINQTRLAMLN
jgi:tetratricopeptide (TPR) repeat protein